MEIKGSPQIIKIRKWIIQTVDKLIKKVAIMTPLVEFAFLVVELYLKGTNIPYFAHIDLQALYIFFTYFCSEITSFVIKKHIFDI